MIKSKDLVKIRGDMISELMFVYLIGDVGFVKRTWKMYEVEEWQSVVYWQKYRKSLTVPSCHLEKIDGG